MTPASDASNYAATYTYVPGTLTITPKAKPKPSLRALQVIGKIVAGQTSTAVIVGTGFYAQPTVTSSVRGTKVGVTRDTGTRLTIRVTVPKGTRPGAGRFTIKLADGKMCTIGFMVK